MNSGNSLRKVLIVDPDPLFAAKLDRLLSSRNCRVETVTGLTDAVARLSESDFDCLVMDEALPEMKGYKAVPIVRAVAPHIRIIMTAAHNTPELETRIREQDILYYHVKGFDMFELGMAVCGTPEQQDKQTVRTHPIGTGEQPEQAGRKPLP